MPHKPPRCAARSRWRYLEAAGHFSAAAAILLPGQEDDLNAEANALYRQGNEFGDKDASLAAIGRSLSAGVPPRSSFPRDWAMSQINLGVALQTLERESETARLD